MEKNNYKNLTNNNLKTLNNEVNGNKLNDKEFFKYIKELKTNENHNSEIFCFEKSDYCACFMTF